MNNLPKLDFTRRLRAEAKAGNCNELTRISGAKSIRRWLSRQKATSYKLQTAFFCWSVTNIIMFKVFSHQCVSLVCVLCVFWWVKVVYLASPLPVGPVSHPSTTTPAYPFYLLWCPPMVCTHVCLFLILTLYITIPFAYLLYMLHVFYVV